MKENERASLFAPEEGAGMVDIINNNYSYMPPEQANDEAQPFMAAAPQSMAGEMSDAALAAASADESDSVFEVDTVSSPMYFESGNNDSVSLKTGDLMYAKSLFSFPGRNGLDLDVAIRYNSSDAVNTVNEFEFEGVSSELNYRQFAAGWIFNFSNIHIANDDIKEVYGYKKKYSLCLADGGAYEINSDLTLKNYDLQDMVLTEDTEENEYVLTYANGRVERFDKQYGNIVSITDIFGNEICFEYGEIAYYSGSFSSYRFDENYCSRKLNALKRITDSTGRVIDVEYGHSVKFSGKRIDSITFRFEEQVLAKLQLDTIDTSKGRAYILTSVEDASGYQTRYEYVEKQSFAKKTSFIKYEEIFYNHWSSCMLLSKVIYPTGGWSSYEYAICRRMYTWKEQHLYDRVDWYQVYKLSSKTDSSGYRVRYKYENDYSGYPFGYIPEDNDTHDQINADMYYHTIVQFPEYQTVYTFDRDHNMVREQTYDADNLVTSYAESGGSASWNVMVYNSLYRVEAQQQVFDSDVNKYKYRTVIYRTDEEGNVEFLNVLDNKKLNIKAVKTVNGYIYIFSSGVGSYSDLGNSMGYESGIIVYRYSTYNDKLERFTTAYSGSTIDFSKFYYSGTMFTYDTCTASGFASIRFDPNASLTEDPWSSITSTAITTSADITYLYSQGGSQFYRVGNINIMLKYTPATSAVVTKTISGLSSVLRGAASYNKAFVYSDSTLYEVNYDAGTLTSLCTLTGLPAGGLLYPDLNSNLYYLVKEDGLYNKVNKITMSSPGAPALYAERLFPTKEVRVVADMTSLHIGLFYNNNSGVLKSFGGFEKVILTDNTDLVYKKSTEYTYNSYKQQTGKVYKVYKGAHVKQLYSESYAYVDKHDAPLYVTDKLGNTTTYEYSSSPYFIPTKVTQYAGTANALVTTNVLSSDKKKMASTSTAYGDRTLDTAYTYDSTYPGNVVGETLTETRNGTSKVLRDYAYEYNTTSSANGRNAYVTKKTTKNITGLNASFVSANLGNAVVTYEYDTSGRLLKTTQDDLTTVNTYQANGWILSEEAPNFMTKEYTYTLGSGVNKTEIKYGFNEYSAYGTYLNSSCTYVEYYDDLGRVIKRAERYKDSASSAEKEQTVSTFVYYGHRLSNICDGKDNKTRIYYDPYDRETVKEVLNGLYTVNGQERSYDDYELTTSITNKSRYYSKKFKDITFDVAGRPVMEKAYTTQDSFRTTQTVYDHMGNISAVTDPKGVTTTYTYDKMGNMTKVTNGLNQSTSYEYDSFGNVTKQTLPGGGVTTYTYDTLGRLNVETDALNKSSYTSYYKFDQRPLKSKDKSGNVTQYTYDTVALTYTAGLLRSKTVGSTTISYTYDHWLNIAEINDGGEITSYTYTGNNLLHTKTTPDGKTITYEYDKAKNVDKVTDYSGKVTSYSYDNANRLVSLSGDGVSVSYQYSNAQGLVSRVTYGSSSNTQDYTYNNAGEITQVTRKIGSANNTYHYVYDDNGNMLSETKGATVLNEYEYDALNQISYSKDESHVETEYSYDVNGNIIYKEMTHPSAVIYTLSDAGESYPFTNIAQHTEIMTYNAQNQMLTRVERVYGDYNSVSSSAEAEDSYEYTGNGSLAKKQEQINNVYIKEYVYNAREQLTSYKEGGTLKGSYTYDAEGYRASKTVGGVTTRFYWDRGYTANESDGTNFTAKNTIGNGGIVSRKLGTAAPMYLIKDVHGDTTAVLKNGSNVGTYDYDAFGKQLKNNTTVDNPYRYCGEYIDKETGLIYLRNRFYDPRIGRFMSEDPYWNPANMIYGDNGERGLPDFAAIVQSGNRYAFAMNNPIRFIDSYGTVAYELFDSFEEMAADWAWNYYGVVDYTMFEQSSMVYTVQIGGSIYCSYTEAIVGNPHDAGNIYGDALKGMVPKEGTIIGVIHGHPHGDTFSDGDVGYANDTHQYMYVVYYGGKTDKGGITANIKEYSWRDKKRDRAPIVTNAPVQALSSARKAELRNKFKERMERHVGMCDYWIKCSLDNWPRNR